jgi:hypothetical protein
VLTTESDGDGAKVGWHRATVLGDRSDEARATYEAPSDLLFEVKADQENEFHIEISTAAGWKIVMDD